jgi:hypothetical protein
MTNGRFYRDRDGNEIDEDEAFVNGVLKDGITLTVPTRLRDSQRDASDSDSVKRRVVRVRDGFGNPAGRRPGFVTSIASDQVASRTKRMRDQAYADYDSRITTQWRGGDDDDGDGDFMGAAEGDACTVRCEEFPLAQGAPGHLRRYGGKLVCVPDSTTDSRRQDRRHAQDAKTVNDAARAHRQRMADVYREYDKERANAWREG